MANYTTGEIVRFIGQAWEVVKVVAVTDPYDGDPNWTQRLHLVQRNVDGLIINVATGIRNTEIE